VKIDPENRGLVKVLLALAGIAVLCALRLWYVFMSPWAVRLGKETGFEFLAPLNFLAVLGMLFSLSILAVVGFLYVVYLGFELLERKDTKR
jgi:hypothetical protein